MIEYLAGSPDTTVSHPVSAAEMAAQFNQPLPEAGCAPQAALEEWLDRAQMGIVRSPGPRYFGFVTGGATPAALAGDWLASALDQNAGFWLMSPAAAQTELTVIRWLLELFGLPQSWTGALTTGATMANLSGLAAARQWASRASGFNAAREGLGAKPVIPVITSTEVHQSTLKALSILGLGRETVKLVPAIDGVIDVDAFDGVLSSFASPVIVIANAGEVNTGAFDPIRAIADRCAAHDSGAWLHVDGAFGLYAALSARRHALLDGIERANSVASDAHKWLNVPYDCGFFFVRDDEYLREAFTARAPYLGQDQQPVVWNALDYVPESSRRFRALSVWCALRAAGRDGYREIVERSVANAQRFATWVSQQPRLELMAPVHLNIVCFRVKLPGADETMNDALTNAAVVHIQRGGVAFVTATRWRGRAAIRPAFDNWATGESDVAALERALADALAAVAPAEPTASSGESTS